MDLPKCQGCWCVTPRDPAAGGQGDKNNGQKVVAGHGGSGRAAGFGNSLHRAGESGPFPGFPPRWGVLLEDMLQPKQGPDWECRGCEGSYC